MVKITSGSSLSAASAIASCIERDALAGGTGRGARAGGGGAERHVHAFDLGVGLDHHATDRLERARERVEQTGERQHRVAGEEPAPDVDRGFGDRLVALAQHERHGQPTSSSMGSPTGAST